MSLQVLVRIVCILGLWAVVSLLEPSWARAESQTLTYQLFLGDKVVGTRESKILYLPSDRGEVRLLQAYTRLAVPVGPSQYKYVQRLGGRLGGTRSFTSSIEDNSLVREVQAYQADDGQWQVTVVEKGRARNWTLAPEAIDITSAELLDPERALKVFQTATALKVLATETGSILEGPVTDLGTQERVIGGKPANVHRYKWSPEGGEMILGYNDAGFLVEYQVTVAGKRLDARLQALPAERTFGGALEGPLTGNEVAEEPL